MLRLNSAWSRVERLKLYLIIYAPINDKTLMDKSSAKIIHLGTILSCPKYTYEFIVVGIDVHSLTIS